MKYAIYLHQNGKLIKKNEIVYQSDPSYFSSPFVMKVWYITNNFKKDDWMMFLKDAIIKGALPLEIKRVGLENGLKQSDIDKVWETPR